MINDRFGKILQKKKLSLYRVFKDTGIPKSIVYEWASGERSPVSEYLVPLADYLDCSVDYLLGRTDVPEVNRGGDGQGRPTRPSE